ncbi:MAG: hypothetical protein MJH10_18035 [Epibacterium sp.]|nr:hypothetical protein [Epibacterium sp.]NQX75393.1 hypothetical protein [Epibacterium sp.]
MNNAPTQIWAWEYDKFKSAWDADPEEAPPHATQYIRRDIVDEELALLRDALIECRDEIDDYVRREYPFDHPVYERYRQRDFALNPARIALENTK